MHGQLQAHGSHQTMWEVRKGYTSEAFIFSFLLYHDLHMNAEILVKFEFIWNFPYFFICETTFFFVLISSTTKRQTLILFLYTSFDKEKKNKTHSEQSKRIDVLKKNFPFFSLIFIDWLFSWKRRSNDGTAESSTEQFHYVSHPQAKTAITLFSTTVKNLITYSHTSEQENGILCPHLFPPRHLRYRYLSFRKKQKKYLAVEVSSCQGHAHVDSSCG